MLKDLKLQYALKVVYQMILFISFFSLVSNETITPNFETLSFIIEC